VADALGNAGLEVAVAAVEAALQSFKQGEFVLLIDDDDSCSLALAAEHATTEKVAYMMRHSAGVIRACMEQDRLEGFGLRPMSVDGPYPSVDFLPGATTRISAKDRAATLKAMCDPNNQPAHFSSPGHIVPCRCAAGGVVESARWVEASGDLCKLAGLVPVAAAAEPMREDGSIYTARDAESFRRERGLPLLSAQQLRLYQRSRGVGTAAGLDGNGPVLETESKMWMEEVDADCLIKVYRTSNPKVEIIAIVKGDLQGAEAVPVRVHSECFTGDVLASKRCDCGQQLHRFLNVINSSPRGVLLYIRGHEGRGIGLPNKIRAYRLQDQGLDTVDANVHLGLPVDSRTYDDSLDVLRQLGIKSTSLYTNNPDKIEALKSITKDVVAMATEPCERNAKYLSTKKERLNHKTVLGTFKLPKPVVDTSNTKIGMVYTTWNSYYVDELMRVAQEELAAANIRTVKLAVPGACELVSGARALLKQAKPDAIIVFGVLIRGSSDIYDATCNAVMTGLTELNAMQDTPIVLGVLMCRDEDQALERSHGHSNPARAWADTAIHMASLSAQLADPEGWARQRSACNGGELSGSPGRWERERSGGPDGGGGGSAPASGSNGWTQGPYPAGPGVPPPPPAPYGWRPPAPAPHGTR